MRDKRSHDETLGTAGLCASAVLALALTPHTASASEMSTDWVSARHASIGFASVAAAADSEAVFGNPAGLARMRNPRSRRGIHEIHVPRLSVLGSERALSDTANAFQKFGTNPLAAGGNPGKPTGNSSNRYEARAFPSLVFGRKSSATWLLGAFSDNRTHIVHQAAVEDGVFTVTRDVTVGGVLGLAGSTRGGSISYGLSVRPSVRYYDSNPSVTLEPDAQKDYSVGFTDLDRTSGVGIDAGLLITASDFWLPTLGFAIRNLPLACVSDVVHPYAKSNTTICGTVRSGSTKPGVIRTLVDPTDIRFGFSMTPRFRAGPERINLRLSAEASPIPIPGGQGSYGLPDVPLEDILKAGVELFAGHPLMVSGFAVRAGIMGGEPTWGVGVDFYMLNVEYSSFTNRVTFDDTSTARTRHHMVGVSTKW